MNKSKKYIFVATLTALTSTAVAACYWQTSKYYASVRRWNLIYSELQKLNPDKIINGDQQVFPYKHVQIDGTLSNEYYLVNRNKDNRMGYLIFRRLDINNDNNKSIVVLDGWIPEGKQLQQSEKDVKNYKGIIKPPEKIDYFNQNFDKETIQKSGLKTYANLPEMIKYFNVQENNINNKYYLELFADKSETKLFPARYNKFDFQKPYLTPQKHMNYAIFWGSTTCVGLLGIIRAIRL